MKLVIEVKEEDYKRYKKDKICSYTSAVLDAVPLNEVLDKIRAEIDKELLTYSQEVENMGDSAQKIRISLGIVRKIIDKYREGKE